MGEVILFERLCLSVAITSLVLFVSVVTAPMSGGLFLVGMFSFYCFQTALMTFGRDEDWDIRLNFS